MLLHDDIIALSLWVSGMPWSDRIGRRFKLRDLHILLAVVQSGSMGKAAGQLAMSQPVVSKAVSDMEHALGVRLLDRSRRGVELTTYGRAVIKRGAAVFDELRECVKEIEFLTDPTAGEIEIAAAREDGTPPFAPKLAGGSAAGLYSVANAAELLLLTCRLLTLLDSG